jgi:alkaline phosphatase D
MIRHVFLVVFSFIIIISGTRSQVVSGPMLGPVEYRDAKIWIEVTPQVKSVSLQYKRKARPGDTAGQGATKTKTVFYKGQLGKEFNPLQVTVGGLEFNTTYE